MIVLELNLIISAMEGAQKLCVLAASFFLITELKSFKLLIIEFFLIYFWSSILIKRNAKKKCQSSIQNDFQSMETQK